MERDEKTTGDHVNCQKDASTPMNIRPLTPNVINALGVPDAVMVVVIDKRRERHYRVAATENALVKGLRQDPPDSGCWWCESCQAPGGGGLPRMVDECWGFEPWTVPITIPPDWPLSTEPRHGPPCE